MLTPATLTPPLFGTPARVNPFSLRQDLNGGRCKLLDTPSKSVISLTFTLPALRDPCTSPHLLRGGPVTRTLPRRCQSLPCTPELSRTVAASEDTEARVEKDENVSEMVVEVGEVECVGQTVDTGLQAQPIKAAEKTELMKDDCGLSVELEMVSLERLEEEKEEEVVEQSVGLAEPMDCTKSPETAERRPMLTSTSSCSVKTNGWRLPISNGPPVLPPFPRVDNNNGSALVIGQQWGGSGLANGYSEAQLLSSDPGGPAEQDEVISCPGCCLLGLSLPSVCLRGSSAMPAQRRRASLPRRGPYRNLNGPIFGGSASSSATAATATKALLSCSTNGLVVAPPPVPCEPGRSLPEAQT